MYVLYVYCCPCCVSVICLLHVSVYAGTDRCALSLNSFEEKHVLASYIIIIILLLLYYYYYTVTIIINITALV